MGVLFSSSSTPKAFHASIPVQFPVDHPDRTINLEEFIDSRCPSLNSGFRPVWWATSGHVQTAYCVVGDFSAIDEVVYDRRLLRLRDGGTIGLDFTPAVGSDSTTHADTPVIVVAHGLTGGSHESYVRCILAPACTPVAQGGLGYRAVVVNFRGCAGTPITSPQLYSAAHTDDFRQALFYISHLYPTAPLLGLGFSLGANVLARYLAEEREASRLSSGCILACPWNLLANAQRLQSTWFYRNVYSNAMGKNLQRLLLSHAASLAAFPDSLLTQALPAVAARTKLSLTDFDGLVTRIGGGSSPPFPFSSAHDYYVHGSSHHLLRHVRVPTLAINAEDDPIVQELPLEDVGDNGWVALVVTKHGGHLGWFEGAERWNQPRRWIVKPVLEWLQASGRELGLISRKPRPLRKFDGWITEEGLEHLGCRELEGGDKIVGIEGEGGLLQGL